MKKKKKPDPHKESVRTFWPVIEKGFDLLGKGQLNDEGFNVLMNAIHADAKENWENDKRRS